MTSPTTSGAHARPCPPHAAASPAVSTTARYVAGGEFQNDKIMAAFRAFEGYDPATNAWDGSLPRMRIPRHGFAGAVIGDRLHVVGGGIQTAGIPGAVIYTDTHDVFDFTKN